MRLRYEIEIELDERQWAAEYQLKVIEAAGDANTMVMNYLYDAARSLPVVPDNVSISKPGYGWAVS